VRVAEIQQHGLAAIAGAGHRLAEVVDQMKAQIGQMPAHIGQQPRAGRMRARAQQQRNGDEDDEQAARHAPLNHDRSP